MTQEPFPALKDDYYVDNFHTLAGFVLDTYHDLLHPGELDWYNALRSSTIEAQRLYIRLLTRKGSTFRISRLKYAEIADCGQAAAELAIKGLASIQPPQDLLILLRSFTKAELLDTLDLYDIRHLSRVALTEHISCAKGLLRAQQLQRLQASDQWVTLEGHAHWMLMQLCFFGNLYQDSSEFVLRQLGTMHYENYPLDPCARAFTSRDQIEAHWRYYECEALYDCVDRRDTGKLLHLAKSLPTLDAVDANLRRRVDRLRNRIGRQLERLSRHVDAMTLYEASSHPPARERRVRILISEQEYRAALVLCGQMQEAPYNESEKLTAQRLCTQCQKALGLAYARQRLFKPETTTLVLRNTGARVERLAVGFYSDKGACFHTENTLVNGVLGLFIWDIIFHPLPGAFFNPFQAAPADFNQPDFVRRRADLLSKRFSELEDSLRFSARVHDAFKQHAGKTNPLVRWQGLTAKLLTLAINRIPTDHWQALFSRILADPRENSSGFPDLVRFPEAGGYEFIEIKGPGDALQSHQRRWMQYFDHHGIACRLVHIRYRGSESLAAGIDEVSD